MKAFRTNWDKPRADATKDVIYRERANGTIEHWTYSDGNRVQVSRAWAEDQVLRGRARYVDVT